MFHLHKWVEAERFETHANDSVRMQASSMSEHLFERLTFGVTTITLRCEHCGDLKTVEVLGRKQCQ